MSQAVNIMLVEDDPFWQKRLGTDLGREIDFEVVHIAATKEEACVFAAEMAELDVVLMDINLTENRTDGIDAAREITRARGGHVKIIMLTSLEDPEVIIRSFQNGAVNFINKSSYKDIVRAVRDAHSNQVSIHADATNAVIKELQLSMLTPAEKEIYYLKQKGLNKTQIAQKLFKSVETVKTQLRSMKEKLMPPNEEK